MQAQGKLVTGASWLPDSTFPLVQRGANVRVGGECFRLDEAIRDIPGYALESDSCLTGHFPSVRKDREPQNFFGGGD